MTEEEKEAIKTTKAILREWQKIVDIEDPEERDIEMSMYIEEMPFFEMKTLLKIIKKQQKEMASMQMNYEAKIDKMEYEMGYDYISKDKVLKALGYEENSEAYNRMDSEEKVISLIRLVNTECNRLEDIEDQKTMIEIHNIENQRDKYWEDKIRDYYHKICASVNHFESKNDNNIVLRIKRYLEELLEE